MPEQNTPDLTQDQDSQYPTGKTLNWSNGWLETEYRSIMNTITDPVYVVDADLRILIFNQAFKNWHREMGLNTEIVGLTLLDAFPFLPHNVTNNYKKVFETGKPLLLEEPLDIHGKIFFLEVRLLPVFLGKRVMRIIAIIRDITERKKDEGMLRNSEERFRMLADYTYDWEIWLGPDRNLIYISPSCERITGYKPKEFINNPELLKEIIHPDDRPNILERWEGAWRSNQALVIEFRIITKTGELRWIEHICQAVFSKDGTFRGRRVSSRDITERKKIESALIENKKFLTNVFDSIQDGISILDKDLNILSVNSTMEKWYAHAMPVVGKKCFEVYHCASEPCQICPSVKALEKGEAAYELVPKRGLGGEITGWLDLYAFPMFDASSGQINGVIEYVRDVTAQKKAEEGLGHRIELERLITKISTSFVNFSLDNLSTEINQALALLGEFCQVDRSYVFLLKDAQTKIDCIYEWHIEDIKPIIDQIKNVSAREFSWMVGKIKNQQIVYIPSVADLPAEALSEKIYFEAAKIKSLILVPMVYGGEVIGFLGLESLKSGKGWDEEIIILLKIVAEIFSNALLRQRSRLDREALNKELVSSNTKLKELVLRDSHTGLFNHRYLTEIIEVEFDRAKRYGYPLSIVMLDIDYFKSINDVYGHQFGDLVLKQFAAQLKRMVRQYDIAVRFGGEEFVIVSPSTDKNTVMQMAQRLLEAINLYNFGNEKHAVKLKLSLSVASYPEDDAIKGMNLIELADKILNKAKEYGGNRVYSAQDVKKEQAQIKAKNGHREDIKLLKSKIDKLNKRANQSLIEAVLAFAKTIELKDHYTGEHVEKTVHFAREIAKALKLSQEEIEKIGQASILHDLGKIGVSEQILLKKASLTKKEFAEIKKHPQIGVDIVRPIQFLHGIIPYLLYHHERWDGKGYPHGLKGEEIPVGARVVAIADVYQSLTSRRPYRKAFSKKKAIEIIRGGAGSQFDPKVVDGFLEIIQDLK